MSVRFRSVAPFVMLLGSGAVAASTDPAPRTPQEVLGLLKAGSTRLTAQEHARTPAPAAPSVQVTPSLPPAQVAAKA